MTDLIARAYARPPLSWMVTAWNAIHDAALTTWPRRTATAAVVAAGYTALAAGTQMPALYAGAVIGPVALLGAAPYQQWQARRHTRQLDELAASLTSWQPALPEVGCQTPQPESPKPPTCGAAAPKRPDDLREGASG